MSLQLEQCDKKCRDVAGQKLSRLTQDYLFDYFGKICMSDIRTQIVGVESDCDNHKTVNTA